MRPIPLPMLYTPGISRAASPAILATTPSAITVVPCSVVSLAARCGVTSAPLGAEGAVPEVAGGRLVVAVGSPLVAALLGSVMWCSFLLGGYLRLVGPNRSLSSARSRSPSSTRAAP